MSSDDVSELLLEEDASQLDISLDTLAALDIEYTLIKDESGVTLDIEGGARGTRGFSGLSITLNFGPDESFLFLSMVRG